MSVRPKEWVPHVFVARDGTKFEVTERVLETLSSAPDFPHLTDKALSFVMALAEASGDIRVVGVCQSHGESTFEDSDRTIICRDCGAFLRRSS